MKFLLLLSLFSFSTQATNLTEIFQSLQNNRAVLLDVREKNEIDQGMIKGAQWVALSSAETATLMKIKKEHASKKIYVYCRSGVRAEKFIQLLKKVGVKAENLGGYEELIEKGLPTTK